MAREVRKKPVRCPHCSAEQLEPVHAYSTYCRSCGQHFRIRQDNSPPTSDIPIRRESLIERIASKAVKRAPREVYCYACSTTHEASAYTKHTLCPRCGTSIEVADLVVDRPVTRRVDTRGDLTVTKDGFLSNASSICRNAVVEGKISGRLFCVGNLRLNSSERMTAEFIAREVVIERKANCFLNRKLQAADLVVKGRLCADVVCSGTVHIEKKGYLEGNVLARAIDVKKGGWYEGELRIGAPEHPDAPPDHPPEVPDSTAAEKPSQLGRWLKEE